MTTAKNLPTVELLRECFDYNPATGELRWKTRPRSHFVTDYGCNLFNKRFSGSLVGTTNKDDYIQVRINEGRWLVHRIVWKLLYGQDPKNYIDHINENRTDNRAVNLREATRSQIRQGSKGDSGSSSDYKGVYLYKTKTENLWRASITVGGKCTKLGTFKTPEEAHAAYCAAAERIYGEFANFG